MSEVEIALLHAGLVVIALVTSIDFEKRTGEIPNLVPLAGIVCGIGAGLYTGRAAEALEAMAVLGLPAILAYNREALRPDAAKLALGLGPCLGLGGAAVTLVLGAIWVYALAGRKAEWKKLQRPMPRFDASPRIAVFATVGAASGVAAALVG
ncbi:MAG: hypothetical protein K1X94_16810 [Sandaracinaceae bacterium]|nr:hypothetical protein [Sandaracinaceae bacterium]